jgi:hypothetical protein
VEKEKAVADLIAIRKINRNIEKYVYQLSIACATTGIVLRT